MLPQSVTPTNPSGARFVNPSPAKRKYVKVETPHTKQKIKEFGMGTSASVATLSPSDTRYYKTVKKKFGRGQVRSQPDPEFKGHGPATGWEEEATTSKTKEISRKKYLKKLKKAGKKYGEKVVVEGKVKKGSKRGFRKARDSQDMEASRTNIFKGGTKTQNIKKKGGEQEVETGEFKKGTNIKKTK